MHLKSGLCRCATAVFVFNAWLSTTNPVAGTFGGSAARVATGNNPCPPNSDPWQCSSGAASSTNQSSSSSSTDSTSTSEAEPGPDGIDRNQGYNCYTSVSGAVDANMLLGIIGWIGNVGGNGGTCGTTASKKDPNNCTPLYDCGGNAAYICGPTAEHRNVTDAAAALQKLVDNCNNNGTVRGAALLQDGQWQNSSLWVQT